jgi:acyl carrier protein
VLNKIVSILKPEGRIIVIDNDFEYHLSTFPQIEELKELYKAYRESRMNDGGDPCIGRRLPDLLKQAGFSQIDLDILSAHSRQIGDSPFLSSEGGGIPSRLAKSGFLQESVFHSLVRKWKEMLENPDHSLYRQLFAASGILKTAQNTDYQENLSSKSFPYQSGPLDYRQFLHDIISVSLNTDSALVDENTPLIDAGLDSVGALDIQNALKEAFNIEIPISAMLGGATPYQIAESLRDHLENHTSQNPDSSASSDTEEHGIL